MGMRKYEGVRGVFRRESLPVFLRGILLRGFRRVKLVALLFAAMWATAASAAPALTDRILLTDSIVPLTPQAEATVRPLAIQQLGESMEIEVALQMRSRPKLMAKIARGEIISSEEMDREYLPLATEYELVRKWLAAQGMQITGTPANRLSIYVRGTILQLQQSFQTDFVQINVDGANWRAARTSPSVPAEIAAPVLGINGLQPYIKPRRLNLRPTVANQPPYFVSEIRKAYGADAVSTSGSGQTIAILIDSVPRDSDMTTFWSVNNVAQSLGRIQKVLVTGTSVLDSEGEATLDVEW